MRTAAGTSAAPHPLQATASAQRVTARDRDFIGAVSPGRGSAAVGLEADDQTEREILQVLGAGAGALTDVVDHLELGANRIHLVDVPGESRAVDRYLRIALGAAGDAA